MTDVARVAGVSQTSVSLILNRMVGARISESTRDRVFEAAREIGYELPGSRRPFVTASECNVIAYVVDEISTSPHPVVSFVRPPACSDHRTRCASPDSTDSCGWAAVAECGAGSAS